MMHVDNGQCGLCMHFGEQHPKAPQLVQIRTKHEAPESYVDECHHPKLEPLHLKVTPLSGCVGFEPVKIAKK